MNRKTIAEFTRLQERLIKEAGGKSTDENGFRSRIEFVIESNWGRVFIVPFGDWVACRFETPYLGMQVRPCNSYTGKCNFHDTTTADGSLAFENFLRKLSGLEPVCLEEPL